MSRTVLRLLLVCVLGLSLLVSAYSVAKAATASITLSKTSGPPTTLVRVKGRGFGNSETVNIFFDTTQVGSVSTNRTGSFTRQFNVPASAQPGTHTVQAVGQSSGLSAQASFLVQSNWFMFGHDASHTSYNQYENTVNPSNVSQLVPDWTNATGYSNNASPVVAKGILYIGSGSEDLEAFNANGCGSSTCYPLWTAALDNNLYNAPAVENNVVFAAAPFGDLYAFNAAGCGQQMCSPLWTATGGGSEYSPVVENGVVYIVASNSGTIDAFNASGCGQQTCSPLWTDAIGGTIFTTAPTVESGEVYVGGVNGELYAFNAAGCGQQTCSPIWTAIVSSQGNELTTPAIAGGVLYVAAANEGLYALNATGCGQQTCSPLWSASVDIYYSSPGVANGVVYIGSYDGKFYAFNAAGCGRSTCNPLWIAHTNHHIDTSPAIGNGVVYMLTDVGNVYAFNAAGCGHSKCASLWMGIAGSQFTPAVCTGHCQWDTLHWVKSKHYIYFPLTWLIGINVACTCDFMSTNPFSFEPCRAGHGTS